MRLFGLILLSAAVCANAASAQMIASSETNEAAANSDFTAASDHVTNNGLSACVLFGGKSQTRLTVSAALKNTCDEKMWLSIIEPSPVAVDTRGGTYILNDYSGLGSCQQLGNNHIKNCPENARDVMPAESLSSLTKGSSSILNMAFRVSQNPESNLEHISVSLNASTALGENPGGEASRTITNIPISFPLVPLEGK